MKVAVAVVLAAVVACASAGLIAAPTTLIRAPQHDSAVIQSERLGGNFAYSSVEGHAYQAVNPVVETVQIPVEVPIFQQQLIAYQAAPTIPHAAAPSVLLARK